jgi:hypothetical protein
VAAGGQDARPYWLGPSYDGLPLTATLPNSYIYGSCDALPGQGCAPPYEIQHHQSCARNPLSVDPQPRRVFPVGGRAIAAQYGDGVDVGIGRFTVAVFGPSSAKAVAAAGRLRRRSAGVPAASLPPPIYPKAVLQELKRVAVAHRRLRSVGAVARRLELGRGATRARLEMATLLGPEALADVRVPKWPWRVVRRERRIALFAQALGRRATARRFGLSRAEVLRIVLRMRGLSGRC